MVRLVTYKFQQPVLLPKQWDLTEGRSTGLLKILRVMQRNVSPAPILETDEERSYFLTRLPIHAGFTEGEQSTPETTHQATEQVTSLLKQQP